MGSKTTRSEPTPCGCGRQSRRREWRRRPAASERGDLTWIGPWLVGMAGIVASATGKAVLGYLGLGHCAGLGIVVPRVVVHSVL